MYKYNTPAEMTAKLVAAYRSAAQGIDAARVAKVLVRELDAGRITGADISAAMIGDTMPFAARIADMRTISVRMDTIMSHKYG